jgi:hypothetical protein
MPKFWWKICGKIAGLAEIHSKLYLRKFKDTKTNCVLGGIIFSSTQGHITSLLFKESLSEINSTTNKNCNSCYRCPFLPLTLASFQKLSKMSTTHVSRSPTSVTKMDLFNS